MERRRESRGVADAEQDPRRALRRPRARPVDDPALRSALHAPGSRRADRILARHACRLRASGLRARGPLLLPATDARAARELRTELKVSSTAHDLPAAKVRSFLAGLPEAVDY